MSKVVVTFMSILRQARCHKLLLETIGVTEPVHAAIGVSLGGMQVLQFASLFPDQVKRIVPISCTGRTSPVSDSTRGIHLHLHTC